MSLLRVVRMSTSILILPYNISTERKLTDRELILITIFRCRSFSRLSSKVSTGTYVEKAIEKTNRRGRRRQTPFLVRYSTRHLLVMRDCIPHKWLLVGPSTNANLSSSGAIKFVQQHQYLLFFNILSSSSTPSFNN